MSIIGPVQVQRGGDRARPQPAQALLAETNATADRSAMTATSVPVTVLLYNGPSLYGFNVPSIGLTYPSTNNAHLCMGAACNASTTEWHYDISKSSAVAPDLSGTGRHPTNNIKH